MQNNEVLDDLQPNLGAAFWQAQSAILTKISKIALVTGIIWGLLYLWEFQNIRLYLELFWIIKPITLVAEGFILYRYYNTYTALNVFISDKNAQNWFVFKNNLILFIQALAIGESFIILRSIIFRFLNS